MATTVGLISLGCSKNRVDSEQMLAVLKEHGYQIVSDPSRAEVIIVNTCGFIQSAKEEAISTLFEMAGYKQTGCCRLLVATGCFAQRYPEAIREEMPEVDVIMGVNDYQKLEQALQEAGKGGRPVYTDDDGQFHEFGRVLTTPKYSAYIRIGEGCDNWCSYCAIPMIRGGYRSRTMESIEEEARGLVENGAKELILIAQDTTRYGIDLYGEYSLAKLMRRLCKIDGLKWLRVLYCYPDALTDELLETMAEEEKIVKYIDLPLQHASARVLKRMNRTGDRESLTALMKKIREKIPGVTLRTTLITGFPGETEEEFTELAEFVKDIEFERLGCFAYSQEEGTPAALMPDQIDDEVKNHRAEIIMESQMNIMDRLGEKQVGGDITVLTEGFDRYAECWFGRSAMDAPDIDGKVFFSAETKPYYGEMVTVHVDEAIDGDLFGTRV